jgi:hypothetical protein
MSQVRADPDASSVAYFALMGFWAAGTIGMAHLGRDRFRPFGLGEGMSYALATHGLARIVSTETITLPLRSPFVDRDYDDDGGCIETPRGTGLRRAIGELITCPYCCSTWAAAMLMGARLVRPKSTRVLVSVLAASAAANLLHRAFAALERRKVGRS